MVWSNRTGEMTRSPRMIFNKYKSFKRLNSSEVTVLPINRHFSPTIASYKKRLPSLYLSSKTLHWRGVIFY